MSARVHKRSIRRPANRKEHEMNPRYKTVLFCRSVATAVFCALANGAVLAAPIKIEAVIAPKAESKLDFADGSKRYLLATQREGKAAGNGLLAGATMLEWGVHDVHPGVGANANGYLVFTTPDGDMAYLKYQFRAVFLPGPEGKRRLLANGIWETVGGTGKLKGLRGAGTLQITAPSPKERQWILAGELVSAD
ncbi:MAG: hypothetical protein ACT4P8_15990 [Betaproteobacteria bacterium]